MELLRRQEFRKELLAHLPLARPLAPPSHNIIQRRLPRIARVPAGNGGVYNHAKSIGGTSHNPASNTDATNDSATRRQRPPANFAARRITRRVERASEGGDFSLDGGNIIGLFRQGLGLFGRSLVLRLTLAQNWGESDSGF